MFGCLCVYTQKNAYDWIKSTISTLENLRKYYKVNMKLAERYLNNKYLEFNGIVKRGTIEKNQWIQKLSKKRLNW